MPEKFLSTVCQIWPTHFPADGGRSSGDHAEGRHPLDQCGRKTGAALPGDGRTKVCWHSHTRFICCYCFLLPNIKNIHHFLFQTRTVKGELRSDGDQETSEKLRDSQFQPLQQDPNYGKKKTSNNIDLLFFSSYVLLSSLSLITFALQTLIRYILKQDLPTSLDDSLMLAAAYKFPTPEIHYFYVVQLTTQGKVGKRIWTPQNEYISSFLSCVLRVFMFMCRFQIKECLTVLKKLSPTEAECVIERLTSWARGHLQDKDHISEEVRAVSFSWTKWLCVLCSL